MDTLEDELARAKALDVDALADAIESIGFECTRCGACCKAETCGDGSEANRSGDGTDPHTATVFPDEVRRLQERTKYDWRDVARPMPYGLETANGDASDADDGADERDGANERDDADERDDGDGASGTTFEWALQTDACGDCTFYDESDGVGACTVHEDRPLICRTYPFSVALGGTTQPMGEAVDEAGLVRAHECEGLGRDIARSEAEELAAALKERAIRELEEAIDVRENYAPVPTDDVVIYDSEGPKRVDGTPYDVGE